MCMAQNPHFCARPVVSATAHGSAWARVCRAGPRRCPNQRQHRQSACRFRRSFGARHWRREKAPDAAVISFCTERRADDLAEVAVVSPAALLRHGLENLASSRIAFLECLPQIARGEFLTGPRQEMHAGMLIQQSASGGSSLWLFGLATVTCSGNSAGAVLVRRSWSE